MNEKERQPARDPQDLERFLIDRQHAGDTEGMTALFEPYAVIDCSDRRLGAKSSALSMPRPSPPAGNGRVANSDRR
jgi:hypothetical protein